MHGWDVGCTWYNPIKQFSFDLWPQSVTLTFEVQAWVLCANMPPYNGEHVCLVTLGQTRYSPIKQYSFWPLSVTLTFEVQALVLRATRCLIIVNVCAKFHGNPMMHSWDAGWTSYSPIKQYSFWSLTSKCDLDIWGEHVCQVTWESYDAWLRGELDKVQSYQTVLILTFDLLVWPWHLRYRPWFCARHAASSWWTFVLSFFLNPMMHGWNVDRTR